MARQEGDRQAPGRHPGPRQHGRALHRQDRHAHRGQIRLEQHLDPPGARQRAGARAGLSQQPFRDRPAQPARRGDPRATSEVDVAAWTQDRRGALRLRAPPRLGAGRRHGAPSAAGRQGAPRTCCASPPRTRSETAGRRPRRSTPPTRARVSRRASRRSAARASACCGIAWKADARRLRHRAVERRERAGVRRLRRLPGSAQGERRAGARARCGASGVAVKIVTGDNELVTRHVCAAARARRSTACSPGARDRTAGRPRAAARGPSGRPVLPREPGAEEPRHPRAQAPRARRRLPRRRHQRRAVAALGRRRRSRSRAAVDVAKAAADIILLRAGPRGAARRRARGAPHLRQHHEVHHDGHQLELRQHVQHGGRRAVPALPADAAGADPAQQLPLRPLRDPHPDGQRGRRSFMQRPQRWDMAFIRNFMLVDRAGQLAVRLPHLLRAAARVPRRRGAVPHRLVRRVAGHPGAGDLRHPHPRQPPAQPAQPRSSPSPRSRWSPSEPCSP